jgi:hypothetical protein
MSSTPKLSRPKGRRSKNGSELPISIPSVEQLRGMTVKALKALANRNHDAYGG